MVDLVRIEREEGVATVTLNRPDALNALSMAMRWAIADTFTALRADDNIRVIVLTGAGRAFTAGLDLKELGQTGFDGASSGVTAEDLEAAIRGVGKPVIGAINGFAITGGFEIALMCDILIASSDAKFADTHVRMGVVPGWGLSQRLSRLIGASRAKELSLTGNYLDAQTAERWGLVNHVLAPDELLPYCQQLARDICSTDPETSKQVHRLIDFGWEHSLAEGLHEEKVASVAHKDHLSAEILEKRRGEVQSRGRKLSN